MINLTQEQINLLNEALSHLKKTDKLKPLDIQNYFDIKSQLRQIELALISKKGYKRIA